MKQLAIAMALIALSSCSNEQETKQSDASIAVKELMKKNSEQAKKLQTKLDEGGDGLLELRQAFINSGCGRYADRIDDAECFISENTENEYMCNFTLKSLDDHYTRISISNTGEKFELINVPKMCSANAASSAG